MDRVGIVGAGVAAAGVATAFERSGSDASTTVLERSTAVGGRATSRSRGDVVYDYGANYLKADDDRVGRLVTGELDTTGLVDVTEPVYTFDAAGSVAPGREADEHKWTYKSGLRELTRRLFDRTDATVHTGTRVHRPVRTAEGWRLRDATGTAWGPFDAVVLTPPAPVAADLLARADWDGPVRDRLEAAASAVDYRAIWSAVLGYPFELDRPYYALVNTDKAHDVGWISREECKQGHVPAGESVLIVQANDGWSRDHADDDPEANARRLAELAAGIVGEDRLRSPDWTDGAYFPAALPESGVARDPLEDGAAAGLYCAGDWVAGDGRIHAALRSGLETGEALRDRA